MANMTFKASLLPNSNLGYSLGTATLKWKINGYDDPSLTDENVYQSASVVEGWRKLLLKSDYSTTAYDTVTATTNLVYAARLIEALPSSGSIRARRFYAAGTENGALFSVYNNGVEVAKISPTRSGSVSTAGYVSITIGNSIPTGLEGNAIGQINIYGSQTTRHILCSDLLDNNGISYTTSTSSNGYVTTSTYNYKYVHFQNYKGSLYLAHTGSTSAIGNADVPVYVAEYGRLTAGTSITGTYVHRAGDTMIGSLIMSGTTATPAHIILNSATCSFIKFGTGVNDNLIGRNGLQNIWINGWGTGAPQPTGKVYIGTGYDSSSAAGYNTFYIAIPNTANSGMLNYYSVLHTGLNTSATVTTLSAGLVVNTTAAEVRSSDIANNNLSVSLLVGSGHLNHGLYSYGYAPTASTYTANAKWMVWRDKNGNVLLNGSAAKLTTAVNINDTPFDGSTAITTVKWGTARTITIGATGKSINGSANVSWTYNEIGATVVNAWSNGATAGPKLTVTVNGVAASAAAIPTATTSLSGIVTTTTLRFKGRKGFGYMDFFGLTDDNAASRYTWELYIFNHAGTKVGEVWYDVGNATNITSGRYYFRQYSPKTTADTATTGFYETYRLPAVAIGMTTTKSYDILTTNNYPDSRYVLKAGDTMTGVLGMRSTVTKGTTPSSSVGLYIQFLSNTGTAAKNRIGMLYSYVDSANICHLRLYAYKNEADVTTSCYFGPAYDATNTIKRTYTDCKVYGAVWNDYAEYRITKDIIEPGRCIREVGDDTLVLTTERLQKGCEIVSDTFGFAIGESKKAKTPTAASGRVLAYLYEDREIAKQHIGDPVCSGPNGTVSIMTEEEEIKYPSRIIGTISSVPDYEIWNAGSDEDPEIIKVNKRIWIRVR